MKLVLREGKLSIENKGKVIYSDIYVGMRYSGPKYNMLKTYAGQVWMLQEVSPFDEGVAFPDGCDYYMAEADGCRLYAAAVGDSIYIRTEFDNGGEKYSEPFDGFGMIALGGMWHERFCRAVYNGQKDCNGIRVLEMQSESSLKIFSDMDVLETAVHTAFVDTSEQAASAGFISFKNYFTFVNMREDGVLEFGLNSDNRCYRENITIKSDWMRISLADTMPSALTEYAESIRDFNGIKQRFENAPTGFCTWYYYMNNISEKTIYDNVPVLDKIRDFAPFEVFQIDDGWGSSHFDGNEKFPKGMKAYADYIKEHGMTPGIWLTPFNFAPDEPVVKEHPEWFIHEGGRLKELYGQVLIDATHPGAKEYIASIYRKITYDWGYRYIKLDLITTYISGGEFYDKNAGALQNLRAYYKVMKEACHPDTFLLACTAPLFESAEFFDAVRTSGDIFESWESMHGVFRRNITRWYLNGTLFHTDPDCLMLRRANGEDEECMRPVSRTTTENRTFATAMYVCGGTLMLSDKLPLLTDGELKNLRLFFPHKTASGFPLDFGTTVIPSVFDMGEENGVHTYSFINWSNKEKTFSVPCDGTVCAKDVWENSVIGNFTDEYRITLEPQASQIVQFTKEN